MLGPSSAAGAGGGGGGGTSAGPRSTCRPFGFHPLAPPKAPPVQLVVAPPISGRVLTGRLKPLPGVLVVCGSEAAATAAGGVVHFSPRTDAGALAMVIWSTVYGLATLFNEGMIQAMSAERGMEAQAAERSILEALDASLFRNG